MRAATIDTPRLRLRPCTADDVPALHALWTDRDVRRHLWDDEVISPERAAATVAAGVASFAERGYGLWVVLPRDAERLAGFCGLRAGADGDVELVYGIAPDHWRRGLATEAVRAVLAHAFGTLGLERVAGETDAPNAASLRVMEKAGMTREPRGGPLIRFGATRAAWHAAARRTLAERLREQVHWCERLGSRLYTTLLEHAAHDVEAGGPCWTVLEGHEDDPPGSALALRFVGAVHRLVLDGDAPALAHHYPSAGGDADAGDAWPAFRAAVARHGDVLRNRIDAPVQTNEVGRSAALIGGFLLAARESRLPLRVLEIGASAGLNLRWDHYRYDATDASWGPRDSPVRLAGITGRPPFATTVQVVERAGCDRMPLDPGAASDRLTLLSYVWPDQRARIALLRAALDVAARVPVRVDAAEATTWLAPRLATLRPGVATVVFHSVVRQYLGDAEATQLESLLADAGARASASAPLAWLRMEPGQSAMDVRLTTWPGGSERLVATAGAHGPPVRWQYSS
jgi:RimJ/RimL family protein N-acetyltransferase